MWQRYTHMQCIEYRTLKKNVEIIVDDFILLFSMKNRCWLIVMLLDNFKLCSKFVCQNWKRRQNALKQELSSQNCFIFSSCTHSYATYKKWTDVKNQNKETLDNNLLICSMHTLLLNYILEVSKWILETTMTDYPVTL